MGGGEEIGRSLGREGGPAREAGEARGSGHFRRWRGRLAGVGCGAGERVDVYWRVQERHGGGGVICWLGRGRGGRGELSMRGPMLDWCWVVDDDAWQLEGGVPAIAAFGDGGGDFLVETALFDSFGVGGELGLVCHCGVRESGEHLLPNRLSGTSRPGRQVLLFFAIATLESREALRKPFLQEPGTVGVLGEVVLFVVDLGLEGAWIEARCSSRLVTQCRYRRCV